MGDSQPVTIPVVSAGGARPQGIVEGKHEQRPQRVNLPQFGQRMLQNFLFDPDFRNLNQGSFGCCPRAIQKKLHYYQDLAESRPDQFLRYDIAKLLDESRAAVARLLNTPTDTVVFVPNATVAINTVLRNLTWNEDGKDEILYFNTAYGGCLKTLDYIVDSNNGRVSSRAIEIMYPCGDQTILGLFRDTVTKSREDGKRPKICLFDTVSSLPGVLFPFEEMSKLCKEFGIMSLVDGAQGVGMIKLDLTALDSDFFFTNCHKWLHVPRGCAVLCVPFRNQELILSSVPTSHGYVSTTVERFNPLPPPKHSKFVNKFLFVGTIDSSPYLCVKDAIKWREEVLGGEERILEYIQTLAKEGGRRMAEIMGTTIMDNDEGTLKNCGMANVALPLTTESVGFANDTVVATEDASRITQWMEGTMMRDYKTFIAMVCYRGRWWARMSAQVYLEMTDFEWAAHTLLLICGRVLKREYKLGK